MLEMGIDAMWIGANDMHREGTMVWVSDKTYVRRWCFRSTSETCCVTFSLLHTGMNEDMTGV
jgi:DNA/RNA-binding domain of Phe-tRNA-synthetase-like protein